MNESFELIGSEARRSLYSDSFVLKCTDHEETKKIFCFDCNQLICRDCVVIDHASHKYEFVKKAAPETRKKLAEHLSPLKNLLLDLSTAVSRVRDTKQEVQAEGKLMEEQVNAKFQELHDILEQCKAHVLRESRDIVERKMEKLTVQDEDLGLSVGCVQSLVDFVERTLENASDEELITMQEQVVSRIDSEVVKRGKEAASADPVEKADFGVEVFVSEDLKKLCESNAVVCEGNFKPVILGEGIRVAEANKSTRLTLLLPNNRNQQIVHEIGATLISVANQSSHQLEAVSVKKGVYRIEYIPKVRGRHHLQISVDGQLIPQSPFSVLVRIPLTRLYKPVRMIRNKVNGLFLAIDSSERLVVTNYHGDVVIMSKKGVRLHSISKSKHGFENICGVAVDKEDNIYVSDSGNHCIYKFNQRGKLQKKFGEEGSGPGEFLFPRGIAIAGNQVFVCDRYNHRIQVLTTNLELVTQITGSVGSSDESLKQPESIAVDGGGMLHISEFGTHRIQVFTRDGQFVSSFGKQELSCAEGVCVHGGYVYVVDHRKKLVFVFTKGGQLVTSFGNGHITDPYGVSVDSDGFVYVCSKECIVVF